MGNLCGDYGGFSHTTGEPCQRKAGEGTQNDEGRCWQHVEDPIVFSWREYEEPWVRLPGETAKSFEAFRIFRDLGAQRSVAEAYRRYVGRTEGTEQPATYFWDWSRDFAWRDRALAYDDHKDRMLRAKVDTAKADVFDMFSRSAKMCAATVIEIASGLRRIRDRPMDGGAAIVHETTQLRAAIDALDRMGIKAPAEVDIDTGEGLQSWLDLVLSQQNGDGDPGG